MTRLTIMGEVNSLTGYGQHLYQIFRYLRNRGVHVSVRAISQMEPFDARIPSDMREHLVYTRQPEQWELLLGPPHHIPTPGRDTIYFTMWESTQLPGPSVDKLNMAKAVIVPCEWNRRCFESSGVTRPIFVVPLGFNPAAFFYRAPLMSQDTTIFTAAGRTSHGRDRKGLDAVVRSFRAAFPDKRWARLKIKCHPDCSLPEINDENIEVTRAHMNESALADWLAGCHAFVSAATAEGWGLWQLQAMAVGRPVIAAVYGGLTEFMTGDNSYPVHYREANSSEHWGGKWALPDLEHMIGRMRSVHWDGDTAAGVGQRAEESVRHLTWDNAGEKLYGVLQVMGALPFRSCPGMTINAAIKPKTKSVLNQARDNGWPVQELVHELKPDEFVFNPTVVKKNGELLWFHRSSFGPDRTGSSIFAAPDARLTKLSDRIPIIPEAGGRDDVFEDPRAYNHEGQIVLSYTRVIRNWPPMQELAFLNDDLTVRELWVPQLGGNGRKPEKNWIWFNHDESWYVIHWLEPMRVFEIERGSVVAEWTTDKSHPAWLHGLRHGGAHPTRIGCEYFGFCHSLMPWFGKDRSRYYLSAYAFEAKPPFALTRLSYAPFLESEDDLYTNPCSCVIAGGAVLSSDMTWTLAIGARDEQCLKVEIPHEQILQKMVRL